MAFTLTGDLNNDTGRVGVAIGFGSPVNLSQIFSGSPLVYPGSTIRIEESLEVLLNVDVPEWVDIDYHWWQPHEYLGTWQALGQSFSGTRHQPEFSGYINGTSLELRYYSDYTVVANPNTPNALVQGSAIVRDCNFVLDNFKLLGIPGLGLPLFLGSKLVALEGSPPVLKMDNILRPAPLQDREFIRQLTGIGLYLLPGVSGNSYKYTIRAINQVYVDYPAFSGSIACDIVQPDQVSCNTEFNSYLLSTNASATELTECPPPPEGGGLYVVETGTFVCSSDSTFSRPYWRCRIAYF